MHRSARSLLTVSVLVPAAMAFAVAAAPSHAAPGPTTTLLYDTATDAAPATRNLPKPVVRTAGKTAEKGTATVDKALAAGPVSPKLRTVAERHCTLNPGKTVNSHTGIGLPEPKLPTLGKDALGVVPKGDDCLSSGRRVAMNPPTPSPISLPLPDLLAPLGVAKGGLPLGGTPVAPGGRLAGPKPSGDVLDEAARGVGMTGDGVDHATTEVRSVVEVLKAGERAVGPVEAPLSLP
ncbi:hypothetical protein BZB76_0570 [Actinomadura pelletieri DSM 43383]|uniref:Uncharacterized protein n=1 Tax=Actinomadura pelletieri DSM 43383 TaxID=1120940 RepID=A0A495QYK5_9ACTN|nr:hypothetical protein [Actinomadura pelletieri]RKS79128.1 hypothetical protein BZB76_0570 [Actinomadura pelletieri DSM 43383]